MVLTDSFFFKNQNMVVALAAMILLLLSLWMPPNSFSMFISLRYNGLKHNNAIELYVE